MERLIIIAALKYVDIYERNIFTSNEILRSMGL